MVQPYHKTSPYARTDQTRWYLDVMTPRDLQPAYGDKDYVIPSKYHMRPDLAAHELYGNSMLWWVFAQVNKNTIMDPIYDFVSGKTIQIPDAARVHDMR